MNRVAIVDDDQEAIEALAVQTVDANMEPIPLTAGFQNLESAVEEIKDTADAALCDHRLLLKGYADFRGAHLVARLYSKSLPAILVTQFLHDDSDISIRKYKERIPVLLTRDETNADTIRKGLSICKNELSGHFLPTRKLWRTMVCIEAMDQEGTEDIVRAVVLGWNPHEQIRFPADLMPLEMRQSMFRHLPHDDFYVCAQVNIGAEKPEDLYLRDFEPTWHPNPGDGLA